MERERGIVLGVGLALALVVAGAFGAYLWLKGPETHTVEPGAFTETEDGALIGAEADAIDGPLEVKVEQVDASQEPEFEYLSGQIQDASNAWEFHTEDLPKDAEWRSAPQGTTFVAALPVPEDFDREKLTGLRFEYGDHIAHSGASNGTASDAWAYKTGFYHPGEDLFLMTLPSIGSEATPTRIMVVEHGYKETRTVDGPIEAPWSGSDAERADQASAEEASILSFAGPSPSSLEFEPLGDPVTTGATGADGFQAVCHLDDCSESRNIRGFSIESRLDAVQEAIEDAVEDHEDLEGTTGPNLEKTTYDIEGSSLTMENYEINLHGPNADPGLFTDALSHERCDSNIPNGWYNPNDKTLNLCLNTAQVRTIEGGLIGSLEASKEFAAHELFHAYQRGYNMEPDDGFVTEGTARFVQAGTEPLELSSWEYPPPVGTSAAEESYRMEYFYHHLFSRTSLGFDDLGDSFQEGLKIEDVDTFLGSQPSMEGLGDPYWEFTKDLVYEDEAPSVRPPDASEGTCEFYEMDIDGPPNQPGVVVPQTPDPIDVDDHRIGIDPGDYEVRIDGGAEKIEDSLTALTSDVYSFEIAPTSVFEQVWLQITLVAPDENPVPEMRMKLYDEEAEGTTECWDDTRGREAERVGGSAVIDVWDEEKDAVLLVSNVEIPEGEEMSPVDYELHFKACPIWGREGANAGGNYHVIGCEDDAGGVGAGSSFTQMGFNPLGLLGLGGLNFQADPADDEPEPGDRIWIESGSDPEMGGGITRPSFAYDQVYTAFGLGAFRDLPGPEETPGDFGSGPAMSDITPAGRVTAYDAETGEEQWMATDEAAKLKIGGHPGFSGSGLYPVHEPIVGNGLVYVIGGHFEVQPDLWPENATGRERIPLSSEGILAFDAFTGELVWEKKPDHDPDRETIHLGAGGVAEMPGEGSEPVPRIDASSLIFLCEDRLFVYGIHSHPGYYTFGDRGWRDEWVANDPEWTLKLWELDADTGETRRSWELPRGGSSVSIRDCSPVVAGFASPGTLTQYNPETGDVDQQLADIFDPPPDPNATVRTAGVSGMVLEDETVVVGTSIQDGEETRGKVYGLEPGGERWTYEMNTSAPDPVIVNGTVYLLTNEISLNQEASEEDGPEDPTDVVDQESHLHAVDARTGEEKWVIEASTSMTATPDRVYLGKGLEDLDPMGGSVHAVDPETGETVWTNEEEIPAPEAWTGAYVDGVLYVQAGGNTIALKG